MNHKFSFQGLGYLAFILSIGLACTITIGETGKESDSDCSGEHLIHGDQGECICSIGYDWCYPNDLTDLSCCSVSTTPTTGIPPEPTTSVDPGTGGDTTTSDPYTPPNCDGVVVPPQILPMGTCDPALDELYCSNIQQTSEECELLEGVLYLCVQDNLTGEASEAYWIQVPDFGPEYCQLVGDGTYIGCHWNDKGDAVPVCVN